MCIKNSHERKLFIMWQKVNKTENVLEVNNDLEGAGTSSTNEIVLNNVASVDDNDRFENSENNDLGNNETEENGVTELNLAIV